MYSSDTLDDDEVSILPLVVFCIILPLGILGNMLVIWIASTEMKKTVGIIWLLNLSIADLIFTAMLPFSIVQQAMNSHWPFGNFLCKLVSFTNQLNMFASVFFLSVISLDRCVFVMLPAWSQNHRTVKFAKWVSGVVWILVTATSFPFFLVRGTKEDTFIGKTHCFYTVEMDILSAFIVTRFVLAFLIPFIIIVTCYTIITIKIRRKRKKVPSRLYKLISMIILAFFVCWLPFHVLNIIHVMTDKELKAWLPIVTSVAYANSCINPILYVFTGHGSTFNFKKRIKMTFRALQEELSYSGSKSENRQSRDIVESMP
ncbi:C3a anaphylatoxin chemotactic receptor [Rhincodon typus]|uniref:C3a anaphylatoxin chemotactic receptor n=1 Tax=Rhincodon typus TaxID=259920 RepID=UPI002030ED67|nr:C3a anaphylatoxin chemotactic receptor [Rhincodon typus]